MNPKPETRNPNPETRNQKPEHKTQTPKPKPKNKKIKTETIPTPKLKTLSEAQQEGVCVERSTMRVY